VNGVIVTYPWLWTVCAVVLAGYVAMWVIAFAYGRREYGIGYQDGCEAGTELGQRLAPALAELPTYAGTVTTMGLPDDTFPGYLPAGRHAAAVGPPSAERMSATGDLSMLTARLNADLFLADLEDWDTRTMAKLEGMLT
jgi:hypothetical protein